MSPAPSLPGEPRSTGAREVGLALGLGLAVFALFSRSLAFPRLETLDGAAGAGAALGARVLALGLHSAGAVLVFSALRALGLATGASALVAAFHGAHPLQVEPVAWLAQRGTLLASCAFLLALALCARRARARPHLAALAGALLLAGLRFVMPVPDVAAPPELALPQRLLHVPLALGRLSALWAWPAELTPFHGQPGLDGVETGVLAAGWAILAVVVGALLRARPPAVAWGGLAFVLSGFLAAAWPAGEDLFAERDAYLASTGLALAAVLVFRLDRSAAGLALGALAVLVLGARSWVRLGDWRSERVLLERALALDPRAHRAHDRLGLLLSGQGRSSAAAAAHESALELRPADALALLHRGEIELRRGLLPGQEEHLLAARAWLERSAASGRAPARTFERLAEVHLRGGDPGGARAHAEHALELEPGLRAEGLLGRACLELSDPAAARAAFEREIELAPREPEGWCGLGKALLQLEDLPGAARALERALELEPDHWDALATLAYLDELRGERATAEARYRRSVGIHPDLGNLDGVYHLGALLDDDGRDEEALRLLERAVELRPRPPHVRAALASARLRLARGELERARALLEPVLEFNPDQAEARDLLRELERAERGR